MSEVRKPKWFPDEKLAVKEAFSTLSTAEDFYKFVRNAVPNAPRRSQKAYLAFLYREYPSQEDRNKPLFLDLVRAQREEEASLAEQIKQTSWVDEIDPTPAPPTAPPRPAPAPNFVKPAVKPDPNARVPRHIPVPPASHVKFMDREVARFLGVPHATVLEALRSRKIPCHVLPLSGSHGGKPVSGLDVTAYEITRPVFDVLHAALCEGHSFEHACLLACEKHPAPTPIVPAESLYAPVPAVEAPVEPDPNKVREGYIPNPYLKGPFPIVKNREAPALDDPNSDAMDAFSVNQAYLALGLLTPDILLTAIARDRFPAVKIDGEWYITRADLKRVRAMLESGFTTEEALKRAGAPVPPTTVPSETSWTDHIAPMTAEEKGEADGTMVSLEDVAADLHVYAYDVYTVMDDYPMLVKVSEREAYISRAAFNLIQEKWRSCRSLREACDYAVEKLGLTPAKADVSDERQWALEALGEGVFTVEQALKIAGVTDTPRNRWALGLLGRGEITLAQAAKLLK